MPNNGENIPFDIMNQFFFRGCIAINVCVAADLSLFVFWWSLPALSLQRQKKTKTDPDDTMLVTSRLKKFYYI
jgi:hypothetical protein